MIDYEERIARWLSDDPGLARPALVIASGIDDMEELNPLRLWVTNVLFDPGYGVFVDDLTWVANRGGNVNEAAVIRAEIGSVLFAVADWGRVSQLVKAYVKKEM